jgi:hypothetical protein
MAKEIIEAALRESHGRVYGPSGAATKLGGRTLHTGIEDSVTKDQQESLHGVVGNLRSKTSVLINCRELRYVLRRR